MTSPAAIFRGVTRERERKAKRDARRDSIARIRDAVMERARGRCENPECTNTHTPFGLVLDHWLGGSGRRRQRESVATCWALCTRCNTQRTDNRPNAMHWCVLFAEHCRRYGYAFTPHREK